MLATKRELYDVVRRLARLVGRRGVAAHDYVVITAADGVASLMATDGRSWLMATISCEGSLRACLPLHDLREFTKPSDAADGASLVELMAAPGQRAVVAAECMMITLESRPFESVPLRPDMTVGRQGGDWEPSSLRTALRWVARAVCTDAGRPHLCGVYFGDDAIVATDGHRMHVAELPGLPGGVFLRTSDVSLLVESLKGSGEVAAVKNEGWVHFESDCFRLTCPVVDETFPPYRLVIPAPADQTSMVEFERAAMLRTLKRLPGGGADVRINGAWEFYVGGIQAAVATHGHTGPDIALRVDLTYLRDALASGARVAKAAFTDPLAPITVRPDDNLLAVVMPQRS